MTNAEWQTCDEPDLMLEQVMGQVDRLQLVAFVRECWRRITPYLPPEPHDLTVVDQFAEGANQMSDYDAIIYTSEAALKAARWAPNQRDEQRQQAKILRRIVGNYR